MYHQTKNEGLETYKIYQFEGLTVNEVLISLALYRARE